MNPAVILNAALAAVVLVTVLGLLLHSIRADHAALQAGA
jgi:hypothetical protein